MVRLFSILAAIMAEANRRETSLSEAPLYWANRSSTFLWVIPAAIP